MFTDSSVSNGCFRWTEHFGPLVGPCGPLVWRSHASLKAGTVVRWEGSALTNWSSGEGSGAPPELSTAGDQLFAYTGDITNNPAFPSPWKGDPAGATLLFGLNFANSGWDNVRGGDSSTSFVPPGLSTTACTAVHVNSKEDGYYNGIRTGTVAQLLAAMACPSNWVTSNAAFSSTNWPDSFLILGLHSGTVFSLR